MHTYFMKYRFTHPTTEDFLRTIEQVAIARGKATGTAPPSAFAGSIPFSTDYAATPASNSSLRPYFNQAVYGTQVLDYAVDSISSDPVQWWLPEPKDDKNTDYLTTVYLRRKGDFILPVTVEVVFADGTRLRDQWDGADRWKKLTYTRKSKIVSAEIDPDHTVLLDRDFFNNSITNRTDATPRKKLANLLLAAEQLAAQLAAWIV